MDGDTYQPEGQQQQPNDRIEDQRQHGHGPAQHEEKTPEQELTDDLLALIASFSGRLYGMRSHKQKELLQCAQAVINNP